MQTPLSTQTLLTCIKPLAKASLGPLLVFAIHILALHVFSTYYYLPNFDVSMHFFGGLAIAYFFDRALIGASPDGIIEPCHLISHELLVFCGTCTVAVSWEYSEILKYVSCWIQEPAGLEDTLDDLFFGAAGGTLFILLFASSSLTAESRHFGRIYSETVSTGFRLATAYLDSNLARQLRNVGLNEPAQRQP
jgi:hypothetical protein